MNILAILRLAQKALALYQKGNKVARRVVRYNLRNKQSFTNGKSSIGKSIIYQTLGGYDLFGDVKDLKKQVQDNEQPKKKKSYYVKKEKTVKEYAINKLWKSLSENQKKQFREWFRKKAMSQARVARSFTLEHELRKVQARVTRISNKYFLGKKPLTKQEWEFISNFSEFFGELDNRKGAKLQNNIKHSGGGWYKTKSSWLLSFQYKGEKGKGKKGNLAVNMIRSKGKIYNFPRFPYEEFVMLKNCSGSIGTYWWKQWLWRYSTNPNRFSKYWYKGRRRK